MSRRPAVARRRQQPHVRRQPLRCAQKVISSKRKYFTLWGRHRMPRGLGAAGRVPSALRTCTMWDDARSRSEPGRRPRGPGCRRPTSTPGEGRLGTRYGPSAERAAAVSGLGRCVASLSTLAVPRGREPRARRPSAALHGAWRSPTGWTPNRPRPFP